MLVINGLTHSRTDGQGERMPIYKDPREELVDHLLRQNQLSPMIKLIIRKYRSNGFLSHEDWARLENEATKYPNGRGRSLDPSFLRHLTLWLRDQGLTVEEVMELSDRKRRSRELEHERGEGRVVVMRKPVQASSLHELREKRRAMGED